MNTLEKVIDQFLGTDEYPVEWKDLQEKELHWYYDDLHCPHPVSPMYFSKFGWWGPTLDYMYERFGYLGGKRWIGKKIGGYVYSAVVPRTDEKEIRLMGPYFNMVFPAYAKQFLRMWNEKYLPEIKRNCEYLDHFDYNELSMGELMIQMEEMTDIVERHFRIHWILNLAQFFSDLLFQGKCKELAPNIDSDTIGKIMVSDADRNWDSLKSLYEIKEYIKKDQALKELFEKNIEEIVAAYKGMTQDHPLKEMITAYQEEFGYKAIYTHELIYKTWKEDPKPIFLSLQTYLADDYQFDTAYDKCLADQKEAIKTLLDSVEETEQKAELKYYMTMAVEMAPLTPDHHFYIDQGTYARARIALLEVGKRLTQDGVIEDPEDIFMLEYDEMRGLAGDYNLFDAKELVSERKAEMKIAEKQVPREWYGTITHWSLYEETYKGLWGWPHKYEMELEDRKATEAEKNAKVVQLKGLPASPGVIEGIARFVSSPDEFDEIQTGEILVCKMTNPSWVVSFSKIAGLVTDTGGATSHPAVVSREFGIPCVVGTGKATRTITTGTKLRVDGSKGIVDILD